jgi:hypothetical protein
MTRLSPHGDTMSFTHVNHVSLGNPFFQERSP